VSSGSDSESSTATLSWRAEVDPDSFRVPGVKSALREAPCTDLSVPRLECDRATLTTFAFSWTILQIIVTWLTRASHHVVQNDMGTRFAHGMFPTLTGITRGSGSMRASVIIEEYPRCSTLGCLPKSRNLRLDGDAYINNVISEWNCGERVCRLAELTAQHYSVLNIRKPEGRSPQDHASNLVRTETASQSASLTCMRPWRCTVHHPRCSVKCSSARMTVPNPGYTNSRSQDLTEYSVS
jgi:hypothetical protein